MRWDPEQYLRFAEERARPFTDLLARVGAGTALDPRRVVDLGCGPGTLTATLLERWPGAQVEGLDASPEMVESAQRRAVPGRLTFSCGDLRDWTPAHPVDVIVSNATLQWVPEHLDLLPRLVAALSSGGWLALQVPGNHAEPAHEILAELSDSPPWRALLDQSVPARLRVPEPVEYVERLAALGCAVDGWETTYLHVLAGQDAVLEWMKGTGLRPVLEALPDAACEEFIQTYAVRLRRAYPVRKWGTLLAFRRIFAVAQAP